MRVLFLQQQPCVRALKYAVGLSGAVTLGFAYEKRPRLSGGALGLARFGAPAEEEITNPPTDV